MFLLNAEDIYSVALPLHIYSKSIGLTSFSITREGDAFKGSATFFSILSTILSTLWSFAMGAVFIIQIKRFDTLDIAVAPNSLEKTVLYITIVFFFVSCSANWSMFFGRRVFCEILTILKATDVGLSDLIFAVNLRKHKKVILASVFFIKALITLSVYATYRVDIALGIFQPMLLIFFSMCFVMEIGFLTMFQYIFLILAVKLRYTRINTALKNELDTFKGMKSQASKFLKIATLHDRLVEVSELINRFYSYPVGILEQLISKQLHTNLNFSNFRFCCALDITSPSSR